MNRIRWLGDLVQFTRYLSHVFVGKVGLSGPGEGRIFLGAGEDRLPADTASGLSRKRERRHSLRPTQPKLDLRMGEHTKPSNGQQPVGSRHLLEIRNVWIWLLIVAYRKIRRCS